MAKVSLVAGTTSYTANLFIQDSTVTTGAGKTGLAFNTASLAAYYVRPGAAAVSITLATQTVTGAWSSGGFVEVDPTNMPGVYRLDIVDAALAAGKTSVAIMLKGATGMAPVTLEVELTLVNNQSATAFMTSVASVVGAVGSVTGAVGSVTGAVGSVTSPVSITAGQLFIKKNTQIVVTFPMTDSTTHAPATGLTVTAQRSIDGAAVGACANSVTELTVGLYKLTLAAADVNGAMITLILTAAAADTRFLGIVTQA